MHCRCFGYYSVLLGKKLSSLDHKNKCVYSKNFKNTPKTSKTIKTSKTSKISKTLKTSKTSKTSKTLKTPNYNNLPISEIPIICKLPRDVWIRIFNYVIWNFSYGCTYTSTFPINSPFTKILTRKSSERNAPSGCGDEMDAYALAMIQMNYKSYKTYSTYEHYPPIYFLRLVCRTFARYIDDFNRNNKRYMQEGYDYGYPIERWNDRNLWHYKSDNPYLNRPFIRQNDFVEIQKNMNFIKVKY